MAKKKTKKQKLATTERRQTEAKQPFSYSLSDDSLVGSSTAKRQKVTPKSSSMYDYDPKLIVADLRKTMLLSLLVMAILFGIYFLR